MNMTKSSPSSANTARQKINPWKLRMTKIKPGLRELNRGRRQKISLDFKAIEHIQKDVPFATLQKSNFSRSNPFKRFMEVNMIRNEFNQNFVNNLLLGNLVFEIFACAMTQVQATEQTTHEYIINLTKELESRLYHRNL
jgi:hypothetical protein